MSMSGEREDETKAKKEEEVGFLYMTRLKYTISARLSGDAAFGQDCNMVGWTLLASACLLLARVEHNFYRLDYSVIRFFSS